MRRDTATATSRPVEVIQRGFTLHPPSQRLLPLVAARALLRWVENMTVIHFLVEVVFSIICGWVGYISVNAVTFGKVELDWGNSSESFITECIGAGVLLALAMLISLIIGYR